MPFDASKIMVKLSLEKKISINIFNWFLFSIYRVNVDGKQGRRLILIADTVGYKMWWI